jgi:hypothetical protein
MMAGFDEIPVLNQGRHVSRRQLGLEACSSECFMPRCNISREFCRNLFVCLTDMLLYASLTEGVEFYEVVESSERE